MSLDISTLALLSRREKHDALIKAVPKRALDTRTQVLLSDFSRYFRDFPDAVAIDPHAFRIAFSTYHPKLSDEDHAAYFQIFQRVAEMVVPPAEQEGLMRRLVEAATAYDIAELVTKYSAGEEVDVRLGLMGALEEYDKQIDRKVKDPQVMDAIEDILKAAENDTGLHWRLPCLNRHMRPLQGGDFIIVAARPDKGKTTFLADNATCMAAQMDLVYPGENRSVMWFNNEGPGKRIVSRCFQAALDATVEDLVAWSNIPADPEHAKYGTMVRQKYAEALNWRPGSLRVYDIHDFWNHEVEDLLKLHKPGLVIFDMVDNIKFGGVASNNGQRTDQLLEAMYQWSRLLGVKYDTPVIANSQISAEGDGMQYPTLPMLKDSKTGKQGAADTIITLGAMNDPVLENSRYIGMTKNKLQRTNMPKSAQTETILDGARARFREAPQ